MQNISIALNPTSQALSSADFKKSFETTPKIYVGTYAKYNNGSIKGDWFDLTDYSDFDELLEAVLKVHQDEQDPELMIQDFECFPKAFYQETWSKENLEKLVAYADFYTKSNTNQIEAFEYFLNNDLSLSRLDFDELKDSFEECYKTTVSSSSLSKTDTELLADYLEELDDGYIESKFEQMGISNLYSHFSWESYANDCKCAGDYYVVNNHIFSSY